MLSYEICEIFKNTYFEDHLQTTASDLYTKSFIFCPLNNSPDGAWHISERYLLKRFWKKWFQCILALMSCSSSFYSFIKHFLHEFAFQWYTYLTWQNFAREKWQHEVTTILCRFVLFWNLVFMCKGSQPRIYADLLRVNSRVKDTHQRNSSAYKSTNMGIWVVGTLNQLFIRSS